jgi:hypothetical protein
VIVRVNSFGLSHISARCVPALPIAAEVLYSGSGRREGNIILIRNGFDNDTKSRECFNLNFDQSYCNAPERIHGPLSIWARLFPRFEELPVRRGPKGQVVIGQNVCDPARLRNVILFLADPFLNLPVRSRRCPM